MSIASMNAALVCVTQFYFRVIDAASFETNDKMWGFFLFLICEMIILTEMKYYTN